MSPHFIAVTETWLTENIPDNVASLPEYSQIFGSDRNITQEHRRGGGVLILARDDVTCRSCQDLESWPECVWIETSVQSSAFLIVGCIYCPPSTSLADINTFTACLEDSIEKIGSAKDPFTRHTSHWLVTFMQLLPNGAQLINTTPPVGLATSKIPFYAWAFTSLLTSHPYTSWWKFWLSAGLNYCLLWQDELRQFYHWHHSESLTISPCSATWISEKTHHLKQPT